MNVFSRIARPVLLLGCITVLVLSGCAHRGAAVPDPRAQQGAPNFEQAVALASISLNAALDAQPGTSGKVQGSGHVSGARRVVQVDPMIDGLVLEQTIVSADLERRVISRLRKLRPEFEFHGLAAENAPPAELLLTGTIQANRNAISGQGLPSDAFVIELALTDLKTQKVVAQARALGFDSSLDLTPSAFNQDSPVRLSDKVTDGYVRTTATPSGRPADNGYLRALPASAAVARGIEAYNRADYGHALGQFVKSAALDPTRQQMRTSTGIYLATMKLGRVDLAEPAFGSMVALGLANRTLQIKLLFNPGTTHFWSDPKVSGPYAMWMRQLARELYRTHVCAEIVGHSSHSGAEELNDKLSAQRAELVRQKLVAEVPAVAALSTARGVGYRENIVGTGSDDARDAVDRRVEFKPHSCSAS